MSQELGVRLRRTLATLEALHANCSDPADNGCSAALDEAANAVRDACRELDQLTFDRHLLTTIMETIPDHIYFKDADSRFVRISRKLARWFGLSDPAQAIGRTDFDFFGRQHAPQAFGDEHQVMRTGQPIVGKEEREDWPDGHVTWVSTTKVPLRDADGRIIGTFGISRDITERRRAEDALAQANLELEQRVAERTAELARSNRDLEQFASIASHDLQAPLVVIGGFLRLLARRYAGRLDADADKFITAAIEGAERMEAVIRDLLDYSRVTRNEEPPLAVDLDAVLSQALADLQAPIAETNAAITHCPLPTVMGHECQLRRVFQNLISNAIKFSGGRRPEVHIAACHKDRQWLISVRDRGIGVPTDQHERIFQIFQRGKASGKIPGAGIGLAVCRRVVEHHGGRIWVESQPEQGSTFCFTLQEC